MAIDAMPSVDATADTWYDTCSLQCKQKRRMIGAGTPKDALETVQYIGNVRRGDLGDPIQKVGDSTVHPVQRP